jgi:hypothetical protein
MSDRKNEHRIRTRLRRMILVRDGFVCQSCGRAPIGARVLARHRNLPRDWSQYSWLEIHHVNGNHRDSRPINLATLCSLCHRHFTQQIGCAKACGHGKRYFTHDSLCTCHPESRFSFSLLPNGRRVSRKYRGRHLPESALYYFIEPFYQDWLLRSWNRKAKSRLCRLARKRQIDREERAEDKWWMQAQGKEYWLDIRPYSSITYHSDRECAYRITRTIKTIVKGRQFVGRNKRFKKWECSPCHACI